MRRVPGIGTMSLQQPRQREGGHGVDPRAVCAIDGSALRPTSNRSQTANCSRSAPSSSAWFCTNTSYSMFLLRLR